MHRLPRPVAALVATLLLPLAPGCSSEDAQCGAAATYALSAAADVGQVGTVVEVGIVRSGPACAYEGGGAEAVTLEVVAGGGSVGVEPISVGAAGAKVSWTLGVAPIRNALRIVGDPDSEIGVNAEVDSPVVPEDFGGMHAWLSDNNITGSTEDLAFRADGAIALGVPGGVVIATPTGPDSVSFEKMQLSGDPLSRALGLAYDRKGNLWTADPTGHALHAISPEGVVTTHLTTNGSEPLDAPNDVAVGLDDRVYLSDPCRGELIAYDPVTKAVTAVQPYHLPTEGGPNGFAFWGDELYLVTENTALLCPNSKEKPLVTAPVATLFKMTAKDGALGPKTVVQANLGVFGDGMAFDAEGNLYVVVDTAEGVALAESRVMVLRKGATELVPFAAFKKDTVMANVAFGRGLLGETVMYGALLAIPPFTSEDKRGIVRFPVGLTGHPLLP